MKELLNTRIYSFLLFFAIYAALVCYFFFNFSLPVFGVLYILPFLIAGFYLAVTNFNQLFGFMVFTLPLSINQSKLEGGFGLSLPGELVIVFVGGVGIFHVIWNFDRFKNILSHWLTVIILIHLLWMFVTVISSSMMVVSLKFFIVRTIYVSVFYIIGVDYFADGKNVIRFYWLYFLAMIIPIAHAIDYHAEHNFTQAYSYDVGDPFYNDHTIYAACLAMLIPFFICLYIYYGERKLQKYQFINVLAVIFMIIAVLLSYSRAGWGSLAAAFVCFIAIRLGIKFYQAALLLFIGLGVLFYNGESIISKIKQNDIESSEGFLNHAQSISNISTDNSNMERLNRWACAIRMFKARPVVGYGPGTYAFQYGQFQMSNEMTWVSVRDGSVGGVHSEYLTPLSEMGTFGFLLFMLIVGGTLKLGLHLIYDKTQSEYKPLMIGMYLGFVTYLVHGIVNFFLDTDKSSVLFWGIIAAFVAYDLRRKAAENELEA